MLSQCPTCGKEFDAVGAMKYCSKDCKKKASKQRKQDSIEPQECPICKKVFKSLTSGRQKYCSKKCRRKAATIRKYGELSERYCLFCGKKFMPTTNKQVYHSKDCALKHNYQQKRVLAPVVEKICPKCGVSFETNISKKKYCSNKCKKSTVNQKQHDKVRFSGNREKVIERDEKKCVRCGSTENLIVHHEDRTGQTENRNDNKDNLDTLCRSCHTKEHKITRWKESHSVNCTCQLCDKEFTTTQGRIDAGKGKFCSKECFNKSMEKKCTMICEYCGKEFQITPSRLKRGKVKYDSMACRKAAGYAWTKPKQKEYNQTKALR